MLRHLSAVLLACFVLGAVNPGSGVQFDIAADPTNLNPLFAHADAASVEGQLARLVFEPFIEIDEHGKPFPELLAQIPTIANGGLSRDGRTIVYKLRPNVLWSDGVPVTADDVLFTLRAILDSRNPVRSREGYDLIDRATKRDDRTVVFHLKRAWGPAVATFFSYGSAPQYVLPAHLLEHAGPLAQARFNQQPVGDGPYLFISWQRGNRLEYASNPRYWRGQPQTTRLIVNIVPDPGANLTLLLSGNLDWNLIAPNQQAAVQRNPTIAFRYVPLALVAGIALNTTHPPLDDVRVRRAIAQSIDREAISQKITLGRYPVIDTAQPLDSWARDSTVRQPGFDPAAADRALDAAGWRRGRDGIRVKDGRRLSLVYVQFPETSTGVAAATFIQAELRTRGIDVTIKSISNAQLFLPQTGILATGKFDLAYVPWQMGADPDDSFLFRCNGVANYARWCDRRVDALETKALSIVDQQERKKIYAQIERIVAQEVPVLFLFDPSYIYAYNKRLSGFYPSAFSPTWNAFRWVNGE
jgi:peptide/nickel transport system substrate-binding protein